MPTAKEEIVAAGGEAEQGTYYVRSPETRTLQTWQVGSRYRLVKVLGEGSFSCVCLADDLQTGEQVALKRVGDVLSSLENAKRVLREAAILKRLSHPNVVALKDLFLKPSSTGRLLYRGGQLVPSSVDLYMAVDYCNQGDLFHLRGHLMEQEVQRIMYQLLDALRYVHGTSVWHRDVKSANILIQLQDGVRIAKLCDFGSARSACQFNSLLHQADRGCNEQLSSPSSQLSLRNSMHGGTLDQPSSALNATGASAKNSRVKLSDLCARPMPGGGAGFVQPLTRAVCTPCYRAPEVVMRCIGFYSAAMDLWSLGCVFGEMLQRIPYVGKSSTPQLAVAPVIAVTSEALTPQEGEQYEGPSSTTTCQELASLFSVVGTPSWAAIDAVARGPWRAYLRHLPGQPSQLHTRFGGAGDVAVDLLRRLLEFEPARRASAQEALAHAYFILPKMAEDEALFFLDLMADQEASLDEEMGTEESSKAAAATEAGIILPEAAPEPDPSKVLAALEAELCSVCQGGQDAASTEAIQGRLRQLLERECAEHAAQQALPTLKGGGGSSSGLSDADVMGALTPKSVDLLRAQRQTRRRARAGWRGGPHSSEAHRHWWLQPDAGVYQDPSVVGQQRLPHTGDCEQEGLDPVQHLRAGRHGEWASTTTPEAGLDHARKAGMSGAWGVSLVPPGMDEQGMDPGLREAIRQQHAR